MPIILDSTGNPNVTIAKSYTPKFFNEKMTGRGGTSPGLLSEKNNPVNIPPDRVTRMSDYMIRKHTYKSGNTSVVQLPMNPIPYEAWDSMHHINRPDLQDMTLIGLRKKSKGYPAESLYMDIRMHAVTLEETSIAPDYGVGPTIKNNIFTANYQIMLFCIGDPNEKLCVIDRNLLYSGNQSRQPYNTYIYKFSSNPMDEMANDIYNTLVANGWDIITKNIIDFFASYEIYDAVVKRSEEWQTTIDKTLDELFENMATQNALPPRQTHKTSAPAVQPHFDKQTLCFIMRYIMNYNIPLDLYKNIYASVHKYFKDTETRLLCKQNLNLLLSDTLNNLNANKANIPTFKKLDPTDPHPTSMAILTTEQRNAVTSNEPLILVQAGAGCGKSSLILSRIDYLNACGVDPEDITVLSFTNAAADHITEKNPMVHSMTIARMIHEIYTTNFGTHELSSIETIINSIDIYYPPVPTTTPTIHEEFKKKLKNIVKNDPNAFTEMNNFIEENYAQIIDILDTIKQTSLELEIIICYQKIDTFIEPPSVCSKYLIIDEVQDNSIFEFIYTLKYIDKHMESLFIVGDCSQTLYEFRASNPRALNILEGSNTFANYQLTVNFRSNQEILDFANIALENIEANQYAKIQLQANSLAAVTEQSFLSKVHFNYQQMSKIRDFHASLPDLLSIEVRQYIDDCLARGEQVAFLAFARKDVKAIQNALALQYPTANIVSLVPEKMYNTTIMSEFIKKYWNDIKFIPPTQAVKVICKEILARIQYLVYNDQKAQPHIQKMVSDWAVEIGPLVTTWNNQLNNGQMTATEFTNNIKEHMLQFEIRNNAIKQALLSSQNALQKENENVKNANLLLSTIHSAKGLEFDNVVIFYRNENNLSEDKKRMYYVALTRAMKTEYVLAYDTTPSPQIQADYITVLEKLHDISPAPNSPIDAIREKRKNRVKI